MLFKVLVLIFALGTFAIFAIDISIGKWWIKEFKNIKGVLLAVIGHSFPILLLITIFLSFQPVQNIEYKINLSDEYFFDIKDPYNSMGITQSNYFNNEIEFTAIKGEMIIPNYILSVHAGETKFKFKKGKENCIKFTREKNIFGDISDYIDNVVVEYK